MSETNVSDHTPKSLILDDLKKLITYWEKLNKNGRKAAYC